MKNHSITMNGKTTPEGNLMIFNKPQLDDFLNQWPNKNILLTAEVFDPGTSPLTRAYYFKAIVPQFQKAFNEAGERLTFEQTEKRMRELCPVMRLEIPREEAGGFELERTLSIYEIDNIKFYEYIETLKQIGAEQFFIYIQDPKPNYNEQL